MGNKVMWMRTRFLSVGLLLPLAGAFGWAADGVECAIDQTDAAVTTIAIPGSTAVVRLWDVVGATGDRIPFYSISLDGTAVNVERSVSPTIRLKYAAFDPLTFEPEVPQVLRADAGNTLYLVQFQTQLIDAYRTAMAEAGASMLKFVASQSFIVEMDSDAVETVKELPFVRWVGAMHPAYKVDPELIPELIAPGYGQAAAIDAANEPARQGDALAFEGAAPEVEGVEYSIMMTRRGPVPQNIVAQRIAALGGIVSQQIPEGFRILATLTPDQVKAVARMNEVLYIDVPGEKGTDMDIAREIGGANLVRDSLGFTGQGVRCEVMDDGQRSTHQDFQDPPTLWHGSSGIGGGHGTSTSGIVYGSGAGNVQATGMLPDAEAKIMALWNPSPNRYVHTQQLVDPNGPYRAVFQSNSWGDGRTRSYSTISAEMDDLLFLNDILICQSQSNAGNQDSRPQAWAKNIVSVGGVYHRNTLTKDDDAWSGGGSIGPAADGRIKPDLTHFYDSIFTVSSSCDTCYTSSFGGTSGATPITAGHFGLMFQMWHEGVFPGYGGGNSVFEDRPAMATAKAIMLNSAEQYAFNGESHDHSRVKQGWGMADLRYLLDQANRMLIVDQDVQLQEFESQSYQVEVSPGSPALKVTMVFPDPMGDPNSQVARINDLSLKVTAPDNTVYWGNNGMLGNMFTSPGGSANTVDTVENVFVQLPQAGTWTIEVIASEINEDGYLATPETDATFALVASGIGEIPMRLQVSRWVAGVNGDAEVFAATPGETVAFIYSLVGPGSTYVSQLDVNLDLASPALAGIRTADENGHALLRTHIPRNAVGRHVWMQAAEFQRKSNVIDQTIE